MKGLVLGYLPDQEIIEKMPLALFGVNPIRDGGYRPSVLNFPRPQVITLWKSLTVNQCNQVRLFVFSTIDFDHHAHKLIYHDGMLVSGSLQVSKAFPLKAHNLTPFDIDAYLFRKPARDPP